MNRRLPERMSAAARLACYFVFGALWASGCAWLVVNQFFPVHNEFGVAPNPWEPQLLRVHGWIAVAAVFLVGWLTSSHVPARWRQPRNRLSGFTLAGIACVLVVTGYALYYTSDRVHGGAAVIHEVLGVAGIAIVIQHAWRAATLRG